MHLEDGLALRVVCIFRDQTTPLFVLFTNSMPLQQSAYFQYSHKPLERAHVAELGIYPASLPESEKSMHRPIRTSAFNFKRNKEDIGECVWPAACESCSRKYSIIGYGFAPEKK